MRYFKDDLSPKSSFKIEPITSEVLKINNEFWITYSLDSKLYEKKLVFNSLDKSIESIAELGEEGYKVA